MTGQPPFPVEFPSVEELRRRQNVALAVIGQREGRDDPGETLDVVRNILHGAQPTELLEIHRDHHDDQHPKTG